MLQMAAELNCEISGHETARKYYSLFMKISTVVPQLFEEQFLKYPDGVKDNMAHIATQDLEIFFMREIITFYFRFHSVTLVCLKLCILCTNRIFLYEH